jgi:hypothetical protein
MGANERRARVERRQFDFGPPHHCRERRVRVERRLPSVQECSVSKSEFEGYFGNIESSESDYDVGGDFRATVIADE